jgi:D-glycero-D-manno-heptose 1,7-bisphosphate phosphatase
MKDIAVLYLDLDGTVRQGKDDPLGRFVNTVADVVVFPEAVTMMRQWKDGGGRIVGVSNQGGIALGHVTIPDVVAAMIETDRQCGGLFDQIVFCRHYFGNDHTPKCWCRKPSIGMLVMGTNELWRAHGDDEEYPPELALMVGDRPEDEQCAAAAGVRFQWAADWRAEAS